MPVNNADRFKGAYASPTIARKGNQLHGYVADFGGMHVPHIVSDGDGWELKGDAIPKLGKGAAARIWAPAVMQMGPKRWVLFYTALRAGSNQMCIWRAHAKSPNGPFVDERGPIIAPAGGKWAIDPYLFRDGKGDPYLLARIDEGNGVNTLKIRKLDEKGTDFARGSSWTQLAEINKGSWEEPVMENAGMVHLSSKDGKQKKWILFYSGGAWSDNSYGIGYVDCGKTLHPANPVKKTPNRPWMSSKPGMFGPGTPTFYKDKDGTQLMSICAWEHSGGKSNPKNQGKQALFTFKISLNDKGAPVAKFLKKDT